MIYFYNNFPACCSTKFLLDKVSYRYHDLYKVGTFDLLIPALVFSGLITFGTRLCCLSYFPGLVVQCQFVVA